MRSRIICGVATTLAAGLLGAAGSARADFLNTGTPTGSSELVLSTSQSFAAEFFMSAGETVSDLSAYLKPNTGNASSFEFEIFSNNPTFLAARSPTLVYSISATVSATSANPGWNSVVANWTPTTSGDYWLAILEPNTGTTLDVQTETSTSTGTAAALQFASTNTPGTRYTALAQGIGLEAVPVPVPAPAWLMLSGIAGLGALMRRRMGVGHSQTAAV